MMGRRKMIRPGVFVVAACLLAVTHSASLLAQDIAFSSRFLTANCQDCHSLADPAGGLNVDALTEDLSDPAMFARWERIYDRVIAGEMPPSDSSKLDAEQKQKFLGLLGDDLLAAHQKVKETVLRRLNRNEYQNTINDLLGIDVDAKQRLPEDSLTHGLDNIGSALDLSDVQLKMYLEVSSDAIDKLFRATEKPRTRDDIWHVANPAEPTPEGPTSEKQDQLFVRKDGMQVILNPNVFPPTPKQFNRGKDEKFSTRWYTADDDGDYKIRLIAQAYQSDRPVTFAVRYKPMKDYSAQGTVAGYSEVNERLQTFEFSAHLLRGDTFEIIPQLDYRNYILRQAGGPLKYPGAGMAIKEVAIVGPMYDEWPPRGQTYLFGKLERRTIDPGKQWARVELQSARPEQDGAARLREFAEAAYRRPVRNEDIEPFVRLFQQVLKQSRSFTTALKTAAAGILTSPDFLYLREPAGKLDDYALASRLSYTFWRTMPDDTLLALARSGRLHDPKVLIPQVDRLLADERSSKFYEDFTDGWLRLRDIDFTSPDETLYPEYDEALRYSMLAETRAFVKELVDSNLPTSNIADSNFAMLNRRLAEHYGLPAVSGMEIRKVKLPPKSPRGGILPQASVMKVSANGTHTSPVVRGAYVLDCLFGSPPPPPPPGIPGVEPDTRGAKSLRQLLEAHRNDEACSSCHSLIDPPGFALENFDVIGGWREQFRSADPKLKKIPLKVNGREVNVRFGTEVDATGELRSGKKFGSFRQFKELLKEETPRLTLGLASRLLMFSTGRELGFSDRPELYEIVSTNLSQNEGIKDLIHAVVLSDIFLTK